MPQLTVIIPFLKDESTERFEETLASFLEFRTEETEILVINGCDYDDRYEIQGEEGVTFYTVGSDTSWLEALNIGIQRAETEFVHPVLCGAHVKDNWTESAMLRFENSKVMAVIPLILEESDEENGRPIVHSGFAYERSGSVFPVVQGFEIRPWIRHAPHFAGAFYRRKLLLELGGFNTDFSPLLAFVDMSMLISAVGYRTVLEIKSRIYEQNGRFTGWIPDEFTWLTQQERLYSRWNDWGGGFGTKFRHFLRILVEKFSAIRQGKYEAVAKAYEAGRDSAAAAERIRLVKKVLEIEEVKSDSI